VERHNAREPGNRLLFLNDPGDVELHTRSAASGRFNSRRTQKPR
jgi:hypothetical protein